MKTSLQAVVVPLIALVAAACGGSTSSEDGASDQNLTDTPAPIGLYELSGGSADNVHWVNRINFHADGTYEADFGNTDAQLGENDFTAYGTYKATVVAGAPSVSFDADSALTGLVGFPGSYAYRASGSGLELRAEAPAGSSAAAWFKMDKAAEPVLVTFNDDFTTKQAAPLIAGGTALVRYPAEKRTTCVGEDMFLTLRYSIDGAAAQLIVVPTNNTGSADVKGLSDVLLPVGKGHDLAIWFESTSVGCTAFDSNLGKNYHFAITNP